jgi:hypothetical protein
VKDHANFLSHFLHSSQTICLVLLAVFAALILPFAAKAQDASITGTVRDPSGAVVSGA